MKTKQEELVTLLNEVLVKLDEVRQYLPADCKDLSSSAQTLALRARMALLTLQMEDKKASEPAASPAEEFGLREGLGEIVKTLQPVLDIVTALTRPK